MVHRHKTGRTHYDLRIIHAGVLRSWSLLKEPPARRGERRLAVEREKFTAESIKSKSFEEEAFGRGRVEIWDEGEAEVKAESPKCLSLVFRGIRLSGEYELRRMRWYPGNRWLLKKTQNQKI